MIPPSSASRQANNGSAASDILAPPAETVRSCADRERRLTEYIRGHTGEDIAVRLTPYVQTACVMPTSKEALADSDNTEFSDDQARQLAESTDADYLVLIATHPANVDNLPISDQLTADRAQQFGYALHELGHIRYTAIADAAALLDERVDDEYQEFVHGLWNSCEDAAIENQLAVDQSQLAADRLELVSRSISPHADGFAADDRCEFTFRDALEAALYDEGIYDTGIRDALCNLNDDRIVFASDADRQAFKQVTDSTVELVATVLSTPNSVKRVEYVLDWWEITVKPLFDPPEQNQQESEQPDPAGAAGESSTSAGSTSTTQSPDGGADADHSSSEKSEEKKEKVGQNEEDQEQNEDGTTDSTNENIVPDSSHRDETAPTDGADKLDEVGEPNEISETDGSESEKEIDPEAINTDQRQPSRGADALDYPDIGGDEDADALAHSESESDSEDEFDNGGESGDSTTDDGNGEHSNSSTDADTGHGSESNSDGEHAESPTIENGSNEHEHGAPSDGEAAVEDGSNPDASDGADERGEDESTAESDERPPEPTPAHANSTEGLDRDGALDTDRDTAHDEAERATPDEDALERELENVASALDALAEQDSGGAAPGSLSELDIMPDTERSPTPDTVERWGEATADAEFVADTLRKALKESRRDARRSGVTSGTFDRQRAGALARGDVDAFHVRQPGDDKQYDLVMILDRSGSMRKHIETAENALVRFALACEDIGINVGVIDFYNTGARLIKPFSVECEHIRESTLSGQYGGTTPLADALGLGRELLEQRRNNPLVLVVTDGKPGDEDAYHDELVQSYAPVCGLTLVLDHPSGNIPIKIARNKRFYDRHVYVHEPDQLADRLDQFAVMFDGL